MGNVGNRVRLTVARPSSALVEKFREAQPTDLADAMNRTGAMRGIVPLYRPIAKCVGPALTVKAPTGDSLMVRKAMAIAQPGDVIVIDGRGDMTRALWGGNRSLAMARKGVAGVVIDGAARDVGETQATGLPLFARAVCPMASASAGLGEVNYPIACGGVAVYPGDIVVAGEEGIVVVPQADAQDVYAAWRRIVEREQARQAASNPGADAEDVDRLLRQTGGEVTA